MSLFCVQVHTFLRTCFWFTALKRVITSPGLTAKDQHLNCCCDILHHQHRQPIACVKCHLKCLAAQLSHIMGVIFPKFKHFRVCCENTPRIQSANCALSHCFNNKQLQNFVTPSLCVCVSLQTKTTRQTWWWLPTAKPGCSAYYNNTGGTYLRTCVQIFIFACFTECVSANCLWGHLIH